MSGMDSKRAHLLHEPPLGGGAFRLQLVFDGHDALGNVLQRHAVPLLQPLAFM